MSDSIRIWNRAQGKEETEIVYGDGAIKMLYGTSPGFALADSILSKRWISQVYGSVQSSPLSRAKIAPFIERYRIPMEEYEPGPFNTFNEFFIRKFKPGRRPFATEPDRMPAFAEARYVAYDNVTSNQVFPVKGIHLTPEGLLGSADRARDFQDGSLMIARLCPVDYHRYHYPDDGETRESFTVHGKYHSVNPLALKRSGEIFETNERRVSILETNNFGKLAYIEVGALCVGKIVQTHPEPGPFKRGQEKGYFLFGGSTVILLGQKGAWRPDEDLVARTSNKQETLVRLGEAIARKL